MTEAQKKNMQRRMADEDRGTKVYTQAEFDKLYGKKTKKPAKKK